MASIAAVASLAAWPLVEGTPYDEQTPGCALARLRDAAEPLLAAIGLPTRRETEPAAKPRTLRKLSIGGANTMIGRMPSCRARADGTDAAEGVAREPRVAIIASSRGLSEGVRAKLLPLHRIDPHAAIPGAITEEDVGPRTDRNMEPEGDCVSLRNAIVFGVDADDDGDLAEGSRS